MERTLLLNSGHSMPIVGLGTGGYSSGGPPKDNVVMQMIKDSVELGYRHIDTAAVYFNEQAIGLALNELISEGKLKREDIFLTTKFIGKNDNSSGGAEQAVEAVYLALKKLNTNYIDLMLIHNPDEDQTFNENMWTGLEEALNKGLVKSIGVSNFSTTQLESLLKTAKVIPAMNQVECHPQHNQKELIDYCKKKGIHVTAFSPLGAGTLITDPTIVAIGKKHNKTAAQVMIRWQIQRDVVVIPKSTKKERIHENIDVFDFKLTEEEMKALEDMK